MSTADRPERWSLDVGDDDVAQLNVPAVLDHDRSFEIDVRFVVRHPDTAEAAWHALTVELDGAQAWSRRIATAEGQPTDSLDYHCRRDLPAGQALRIRAQTRVGGGARRHALKIEAEASAD